MKPISLKNVQNIIDKVHQRYPVVSKDEIVLVVRTFFECLRDILIEGNSISINGFFSRMHIIFYSRIFKNKYSRIAKVKLSTPAEMRKWK